MNEKENPQNEANFPLRWKVGILIGALALVAFWMFVPKSDYVDPALGEKHKSPPFNPLH